jgi:hypothetical protein
MAESELTIRPSRMCKTHFIVLVVVALMLAACTASTVRPTGVVTGVADACGGLITSHVSPHVKVRLYSGPSLVASETIRSGATFRFSVAPGSYRVSGGPGEAPKVVVIRAGGVVTDNIPDMNVCH